MRRCRLIIFLLLTAGSQWLSAKMPELFDYPADSATNTGTAIIVCPGGSYCWHDMQYEGRQVAEWLNANGINAFVLRYRVASISAYCIGYRVIGLGNKYPNMLTDVEDALRYVYQHADSFHIDTTRIGVMGFSAGGHLSVMSATHNRTRYKPAFVCPVYPVVTMADNRYVHRRSRRGALGVWRHLNQSMRDSLSLEKHIPADCPPVFLVNCVDDPVVKYQNSELLDSALTANHVPHRYIQYKTGGHGFGASDSKGTEESRQWKKEFLQWISNLNQ
ncbi:MAG: alpha/beta hydrolase [Paludibacteraceae bacterium]|nr:alpha/beta hydrolase [Paludibacteraceae bacterium]